MTSSRISPGASVSVVALTAILLAQGALAGFAPTDLSGNVLWLDAADPARVVQTSNPGFVEQWTDKSTAGLGTVVQAALASRPQTGAASLGGKNVLSFDGSTDFLSGNAVLAGGDDTYTYFLVWRPTASKVAAVYEQSQTPQAQGTRAALLQFNAQYGFNGENCDFHTASSAPANTWRISGIERNDKASQNVLVYDQGNAPVVGSINVGTASVGTSGIRVGNKLTNNAENFQGELAEIIVYDRTLSGPERNQVGTYLSQKWSLPAAYSAGGLLHQWTFNDGTGKDSVGTANGTAYNGASLAGGKLVLGGGSQYMATSAFGHPLSERTVMAWVALSSLGQPGGAGVIGVQPSPGVDNFDSIVYAERVSGQWMNGSSYFNRSVPNNGGAAETSTREVMMAIVYGADNSIKLYRNGVRYDTGANLGTLVYRPDSIAVFGRRMDTASPSLQGAVNEARIYNYAMSDAQIAAAWSAGIQPAGLIHQWTFNDGSARDSVGSAHGTLYNGAALTGGSALALDGVNDYMRTAPIGAALSSRTLVAWLTPANLSQRSGSVLTIENAGDRNGVRDYFDGICYGERTAGQWMNGSDYHSRSDGANNGGPVETSLGPIMLAITYDRNGANQDITLYRNGQVYATYAAGESTFPALFSDFLLGLRHQERKNDVGTALGDDAFWAGLIDEARVYDHALTQSEINFLFAQGPEAAVPEPATMALLSLAAAGVGGYIRRRR